MSICLLHVWPTSLHRVRIWGYLTTLQLQRSYWQATTVTPSPRKTLFLTFDGLCHFTHLPSGLTNAPSSFYNLLDEVSRHIKLTMAAVYLDDIVVPARSFQENRDRLRALLTLLQALA